MFIKKIQDLLKKRKVYYSSTLKRTIFGGKASNGMYIKGQQPQQKRTSPSVISTSRKPSGTFDKEIKRLIEVISQRDAF